MEVADFTENMYIMSRRMNDHSQVAALGSLLLVMLVLFIHSNYSTAAPIVPQPIRLCLSSSVFLEKGNIPFFTQN